MEDKNTMTTTYKEFIIKEIYQSAGNRGKMDYSLSKNGIDYGCLMQKTLTEIKAMIDSDTLKPFTICL